MGTNLFGSPCTTELYPTEDYQRQNLANSDPAVHQTLRQQAGPGSYGIICLPVWTGTVIPANEKKKKIATVRSLLFIKV
jgi:hypothetical protein